MHKPHIELAHSIWTQHLKKGDVVIDATCGNGHDALVLAQLTLTPSSGTLHCIDIQEQALTNSQNRLSSHLPHDLYSRVQFHHQSHVELPTCQPSLIVYNLGYLPGSDKVIKTASESTLKSLQNSLKTLNSSGLISVMCYPGHLEGEIEEKKLLSYLKTLDPAQFSIQSSSWINRPKHPSLIIISKH